MNNEEIKILVERTKQKDSIAFAELFDFYYPKILSYSLRSTLNLDYAKDIVSNTFIKVLNNLDRFELRNENSFNGWIYKIATNEIYSFFRKQNKYKLIIDDENYSFNLSDDNDAAKKIKENIERDETLKMLNKAINRLNNDHQTIIRLRYFEDLPYEEIAQIMDKNETTVRVYSKRAKEKLKKIIEEDNKAFLEK
jgi:RNA polymerase sigma-70 factor (ECF subfamily)